MVKLCMIYVTAKDKAEAERIARELVSERLVACANIFEGVTSVFRWEGKMETTSEAILMAKSRERLLEKIKSAVRKLHSYTCPCIEIIPIIDADREYFDWVLTETS